MVHIGKHGYKAYIAAGSCEPPRPWYAWQSHLLAETLGNTIQNQLRKRKVQRADAILPAAQEHGAATTLQPICNQFEPLAAGISC